MVNGWPGRSDDLNDSVNARGEDRHTRALTRVPNLRSLPREYYFRYYSVFIVFRSFPLCAGARARPRPLTISFGSRARKKGRRVSKCPRSTARAN